MIGHRESTQITAEILLLLWLITNNDDFQSRSFKTPRSNETSSNHLCVGAAYVKSYSK